MPYLIAELSANHNGSQERALEAIDVAKRCGADAIKLQTYSADTMTIDCDHEDFMIRCMSSTGMASEAEIDEAVTTARDGGCKDLALLHCISAYPARMDQANLDQMPEPARRFGTVPGLSDHTLGTTASVALGACLIEKHFTLSRADKGPDSEFSLEPSDLGRLCKDARDAWQAPGQAGFERQEAEAGSKVFRRSLYVTADLQPGDVLTRQNLRCLGPGSGLPPKHYETLIGKRVNQAVRMGTPVTWGLLHPIEPEHP